MIKGLSQAGLNKVENVEELINLASANGFGAIDTNGSDLRRWIEEKGIEGAKEFLKEKEVIIGSVAFPVEWRRSEEEFKNDLAILLADIKTASYFNCKTFFTYFMPSTDENPINYLLALTKRIKLCARLLNEYGMTLALEFVGPLHLRNKWNNQFIYDITSTLEWIEIIGESNVGVLLDSFHWHTIGGSRQDILDLKPHQIAYVHINDARDVPIEDVLDDDRLYPGEGVIDLSGFLSALKEINYTGIVSQEILTPEEPTETNDCLAEKSKEAFAKVFSDAGIDSPLINAVHL
ncbi:sugar phosphate isomerase/epimerase family protein [Bacillus sp. FSL K6-3431]|uniref:sugar phosphate isomerase/epimerase family protein n=1 Tax=Bacillus sp. FSL K6-3431 TaxID=2921500 RepID=UPI0030F9CAB7